MDKKLKNEVEYLIDTITSEEMILKCREYGIDLEDITEEYILTKDKQIKDLQESLIEMSRDMLWLCHRVGWLNITKKQKEHLRLDYWEDKAESIIEAINK